MILLKKLNGTDFVLNADHIETLEATPDSMITLMNGKKMIVRDSLEEIITKVFDYKKEIFREVKLK